MNKEFGDIRKMLEEHLAAINDNTGEIQALFDFLQELETKVDKLSQRLDQTQLDFGLPRMKPVVAPLNQTERKVFLVLYTEESLVTYHELAQKANLSVSIVPECISSLIQKGIPFRRSFFENQLFVGLEPSFKELQAKENIVNLSLQSFME
ncbi:MAG TPA: hypothetical protein VJA18_05790 [Candidatus Nanoarchaeia archaeon]|nr:hypothetical protein [Candidatus Nanoarchaeia archaeon]